MSRDTDFDFEAAPGLPAPLPAGEGILWQGRPLTYALARDAMGLHWIAGYFVLLAVWRGGAAAADNGAGVVVQAALTYLILGALACLIILGIARAQARATVYTITDARVLMRIGAALPVTFNIPFTQVGSANLDLRRDGVGTIALQTLGETRLSYLILWPHIRPWRMNPTEPALRCIPDAAQVAKLLAEAAETRVSQPVVTADVPDGTTVAAE
jgi:Bacterial PH domain